MFAVAMSLRVMSPSRFLFSSMMQSVSMFWSRMVVHARRRLISPFTPSTARMSTSRTCGLTSA